MIYAAAKVLIFDATNPAQVLLLRREINGQLGYECVGGRVEVDFANRMAENFEAAAIREVKEEVGFDVALLEYLGSYTFYWDVRDNTCSCCVVFLGKIVGGRLQAENADHMECAFIPEWICIDDILNNKIPVRKNHLGLESILRKGAKVIQSYMLNATTSCKIFE